MEWAGVRFLGLGGAFSVDRNARKVGRSFWFEETITDEEVELACENGKDGVDVMLAHDVFTGVDIKSRSPCKAGTCRSRRLVTKTVTV